MKKLDLNKPSEMKKALRMAFDLGVADHKRGVAPKGILGARGKRPYTGKEITARFARSWRFGHVQFIQSAWRAGLWAAYTVTLEKKEG